MRTDPPDLGAIRFRKRRDAGDVLNATLALVRRNARELFLAYLAVVGPLYVVGTVLQTVYLEQIEQAFGDVTTSGLPDFDGIVTPVALFMVLSLLVGIVTQAAAGAYVRLYRDGAAGTITPGVLWDETRDLLGPITTFNLAVYGGFVVLGLMNIVPCLGTIASLVILVWAIPVVSVMLAVRVLEEAGLAASWARARALVKGSWGFAFGALFMAGLVFALIATVAGIPVALADIVATTNSPSGDGLGIVGTALFAPLQLVGAAAYLVPMLAAFFVHGRLVEELEGTSLHDDLDALAAGALDGAGRSTPPAPTAPPPAPDAGRDDRGPETGSGGFRGGGFQA